MGWSAAWAWIMVLLGAALLSAGQGYRRRRVLAVIPLLVGLGALLHLHRDRATVLESGPRIVIPSVPGPPQVPELPAVASPTTSAPAEAQIVSEQIRRLVQTNAPRARRASGAGTGRVALATFGVLVAATVVLKAATRRHVRIRAAPAPRGEYP